MGQTIDWSKLDDSVKPNLKVSGVKDNPAALLDAWTRRRHELVHHGKALKISSRAAHALVDFVVDIAHVVDDLALAAQR